MEKEQCWKTHKIGGWGMKEEKLMKENKKQQPKRRVAKSIMTGMGGMYYHAQSEQHC